MRWRHLILNCHSTWLHGDGRGFRSRGSRIESTGDYRNPPPVEEHRGLRKYHQSHSTDPTILPRRVFCAVGLAVLGSLQRGKFRVLVVSVNPTHVHALVELPDCVPVIKRVCGWCKYFGTRAARGIAECLKNREIWADGGTYEPVDDRSHLKNAYTYILEKQGKDAWTWSYKGGAKW